jgi:hypothetical protein
MLLDWVKAHRLRAYKSLQASIREGRPVYSLRRAGSFTFTIQARQLWYQKETNMIKATIAVVLVTIVGCATQSRHAESVSRLSGVWIGFSEDPQESTSYVEAFRSDGSYCSMGIEPLSNSIELGKGVWRLAKGKLKISGARIFEGVTTRFTNVRRLDWLSSDRFSHTFDIYTSDFARSNVVTMQEVCSASDPGQARLVFEKINARR